MMENGKLPPGTLAEAGRVVSRQGERLLSLINQLLDIQKVKSAVGRPEWRHGNIALFVSTIIESYLNLAHTQRIKLMYTPRQKEAEADFVPDYLQKVVCNLVSNAIKFSSEGGRVLVTLDVAGGTATLRIADSGCGISAADCKHVFEPFYQTESENMGVGSGVGLALVKQIVVSLGGSIKLDSSPGKGSVFTVTLPATAPDGTECAPIGIHGELTQMPMPSDDDTATADVSGSNATDRPLLLVVEDNRDVAHYMCIQLQDGYRLMVADNGEEGLRIANEQLPDIIVTDLMMPRMDGYELCRRIKTSQLTDHIPMVVVTARASESDKLHGLQLGVDAYIYKPFNADELRLCVDNLIAKHRMLRERYMKAAAENEAEATDTLQPSERLFVEKLNATVDKLMPIGELAVDNVAAAMCMSSQQMRRKLNAVTGDTPAAYIRRRQMQTAQAMLIADNDTPVGEIAMRCGFYDMSHFTRVFKQVTGSTPTAFRNART